MMLQLRVVPNQESFSTEAGKWNLFVNSSKEKKPFLDKYADICEYHLNFVV